jgi:hypothetical protein
MPCLLHPALFDLWSSLPSNPLQPPVSSFLLGLNIFLGVVFQTPSNRVPSLRQRCFSLTDPQSREPFTIHDTKLDFSFMCYKEHMTIFSEGPQYRSFVVYLRTIFQDHIASNEIVLSESWTGKHMEGSGRGIILR